MNILNIAYYTGIKYLRNKIALCFFVLTPILFLYLMGVLTGNTAPDISQREKVGFYSSDAGETAQQFDKLLHSEQLSEMLDIIEIASFQDGMDKIKGGEIDTFISFGNMEIKLYNTKGISAANTLAETFTNSINGSFATAKLGGTSNTPAASEMLEVVSINTDGKIAGTKDMASISCLLIFIFYGALLGSNSVISELNNNTYIRLRSAPVKYTEDFAGKLLGNVSVMLVFTVISALAAEFIFNVNLNGNVLVMLTAVILFLIAVNSLGVLLAGVTKNIYLCGLFTFALNYFMVYPITANAFMPGEGTFYDIARFVSPHYYTYQTVMGSVYPAAADVQSSLAILAVMALFLCSVSWLVGRRIKK